MSEGWESISFEDLITERKGRYEPDAPEIKGLQKIEKRSMEMVEGREQGTVLIVADRSINQDDTRRCPHQPRMDALAKHVCPRVHRVRPEFAGLLDGGRIIRQVGIKETGLGTKRQVGDSDDCGIAYAVRIC